MTSIVKSNGPELMTEMEPFRMMREMMRWDPFRTLAPTFMPSLTTELAWNPSFDVRESDDAFIFKADVPGMNPSDLDISLTGNRLQLSGKRDAEKESQNDTVYLYERSHGEFRRTFTLPEGIDAGHIHSELKNGVLTVAVPKKAAAKPIKIAVSGESRKS